MAHCETCGNDYDRLFQVTMGGETRNFDSFECAIQAMAPRCGHCDCRIIGHGVQNGKHFYCSAHCARQAGVDGLADRN